MSALTDGHTLDEIYGAVLDNRVPDIAQVEAVLNGVDAQMTKESHVVNHLWAIIQTTPRIYTRESRVLKNMRSVAPAHTELASPLSTIFFNTWVALETLLLTQAHIDQIKAHIDGLSAEDYATFYEKMMALCDWKQTDPFNGVLCRTTQTLLSQKGRP